MVKSGLDVVDTDGVDAKHLHQSCIALAGRGVGQRVRLGVDAARTTRLVAIAHKGQRAMDDRMGMRMRQDSLNTDDLETLVLGGDKILAIDGERLHSEGRASEGTSGRKETTGGL